MVSNRTISVAQDADAQRDVSADSDLIRMIVCEPQLRTRKVAKSRNRESLSGHFVTR